MRSPTALFLSVLLAASVALAAAPASRPTGQTASPAASRPAALAPSTRLLVPGDFLRQVTVDGNVRSYYVHVPRGYDANRPTPVVLAFHGAWANGRIMQAFSGLSRKGEEANFVVVYPNGKGPNETSLFFNAFASPGPKGAPPDDVKFTSLLLDDLAKSMNLDKRRVFVTGMSNGGMMAHRLAAELSGRIAAVAAVSGTLCIEDIKPARPMPILHFHGTADSIVPFDGAKTLATAFLNFTSVEKTVRTWVKLDGCPEKPEVTKLPDKAHDGTTVTRKVYGPGKEGSEVVLYVIEGGGHTWPGRDADAVLRGKSTRNISANDVMWEFFLKHPLPEAATQPAPAAQPAEKK